MGMPNKALVLTRLKENAVYISWFKKIYGEGVLASPDRAYQALTESIASFEKTDFFSAFNSKYDHYLEGKYKLTEQEDLGMTLFFSEQFSNCNQCHQLKAIPATEKETFSDYTYHNIGVPVNTAVRIHNKTPEHYRDLGLFGNPEVNDTTTIGKFKVPTLRNVAVTAPYMHNGVFKELETVLAFYNKYNSKNKMRQINPETQEKWAPPELDENISLEELKSVPALDDKRINALISFIKILTDQRFEYLLKSE
jgi:cytochrome c peroxidase